MSLEEAFNYESAGGVKTTVAKDEDGEIDVLEDLLETVARYERKQPKDYDDNIDEKVPEHAERISVVAHQPFPAGTEGLGDCVQFVALRTCETFATLQNASCGNHHHALTLYPPLPRS